LGKEPRISPARISELSQSVEQFRILSHAVEFGIFDDLMRPKTIDQIAERRGLNRRIAEKYCDYLVCLEFLRKKGDKYSLTPLARSYLVKSSSYYLGNYITFYKSWKTEGNYDFTEALTKGSKQGENSNLWEYNETSWLALAEGSAISIHRILRILGKNTDLSRMRKVLDLGGGHGLFAIAFTELNRDAEAIVFDLPDVIENSAKANISAYGNSRTTTISGDMAKDDIGNGYDLVQASDSLYLTTDSLRRVLEKVHSSLNEAGILSVKSGFLGSTVDESSSGALLFDLCTSLAGEEEVVHRLDYFLQILSDCGFDVIKALNFRDLEGMGNLIIAQKR
jgi:predicted nicotinamide N-methyase